MAKSVRGIPREISNFGEKQFHDSGAELVEVLRVKASTIRKHFKKLSGIGYLVSVIQSDRVRVYFFSSTGTLLIGENLEHSIYEKIRKTSKLVTKFEKPKPPTEEELRMEATEDLRQRISRLLRRTSRVLGQTEPDFPSTFVTKSHLEKAGQGFSIHHDDRGEIIFEQEALDSGWADGIVARAAFLQFLDQDLRSTEFANAVANCFAYAILTDEIRESWLDRWLKATQETPMVTVVCHLKTHAKSYQWAGFIRLLDFLRSASTDFDVETAKSVLSILHESHDVPLGHEEHMSFLAFCRTLAKPTQLATKKETLEEIHLGPRALCDPTSLGISLGLDEKESTSASDEWLLIRYQAGDKLKTLCIAESEENQLKSIFYRLRLEDIFPKPAGLISHGKDIVNWVLRAIGKNTDSKETYSISMNFSNRPIGAAEAAVLERLAEGDARILENTLIGSLRRVETLHTQGRIAFVPDFNHIGIEMNFLLKGELDDLKQLSDYTLESTIFSCTNASFMVSSALSTWRKFLLQAASERSCSVWPIVEAKSKRRLIRSEKLFENCLSGN